MRPRQGLVRAEYSGMNCLVELNVSANADALDPMHGSIAYRVEGVDGLDRWP